MRLTSYTDYSLRVLLYLAEHPDRLCSISEMAEAYGISHNHLMKVVHELGKAGYVASVRGRNGGVRLGRPAIEINVGEVIRIMEDNFDLVDCPSCRISRICGLRGVLGEALGAFMSVLDRYSLADLLRQNPGPSALFPDLAAAGNAD